jgi:class 3 adenylate cyclase/predicted ATPase
MPIADLEEWLKASGLAQCHALLVANDVDFEVLTELTEADLAKLGMSLGHRRKLLRALAARGAAAAGAAPVAPDVPAPAKDAERRQVTVMFCDVVDSTQLASALDPEDMIALIRRYQDACAGAIARYEGFVAKFMGDGVLAYFGYPQASEDAAEHAVHSAFAIVDAIRQFKRPDGREFQARIGIATGIVVIGDIVGEGAAREHSIAGETPNLAARLQSLAAPNAILVGYNTHQLLGRRFEYDDLGEHPVKGYAAPIRVWRVLREAVVERRFAATRDARRGAFVGRGEETALLLDRWRQAGQGHGQLVVISGDAGMGKSRQVDMLFESIGSEPCYHVTCQCSPYHTNSALHPVIRHLERAAGFLPDDPDAVRLEKLEALFDKSGGLDASARGLLADLLSLPAAGYPSLELSAVQRKTATNGALIRLLQRLADHAPVMLLLEDAHWSDPSTLALWTQLVDSIASTRLLALVTARPDFASPWAMRAHVSALEISRLDSEESTRLVAEIAAPRVLAPAVVAEVVAKGDGVPLFIEELTKSVLESATPERPAVPATLQDSLLARLDRLGPAREIAQVAAVIGQQFSHALLAAVTSAPAAGLGASMQRLIDAGLVHRHDRATEPGYSFKHALLRDVAYENLLRVRRQQLHERIGRALAADFAATAETEPELLAHHFHHAGLFELACTYRERAGNMALARSSFTEAVAHYTTALGEATHLPDGVERTSRELGLLLELGPPLSIIKGAQSSEVEDVYRRAHANALAVRDETGLFKATWGLWYNANIGRRLDLARDHADALMTLGRKAGDDDLLLEGFHCRWSTAQFRGEIATAMEMSREGIDRYDPARHSWMGPVFGGHDPGVCAYCVQATMLGLNGRHAQGRPFVERALALAAELRHPNTRAHSLLNALLFAQIAGDLRAVAEYSQRATELAEKFNIPPVRAHAMFMGGWALTVGADPDAGMSVMEAEFPRASAVGPLGRYYAVLLADGRARSRRYADALAVLEPALLSVTEPGVGFFVSELHRLRGHCLLRMGPGHEAEALASLRTALDVAARQSASLLELKASVSLAHAAVELGRPKEGVGALRALCARLPADFAGADLDEARRLLSA